MDQCFKFQRIGRSNISFSVSNIEQNFRDMGRASICPRCNEKFESKRLYNKHLEEKCNKDSELDNACGGSNHGVKIADSESTIRSNNITHSHGHVFIPFDDISSSEVNNMDEIDQESDGEVEVLKANIFKFQGNLTEDDEVKQGILHYEYYDDFNDEDDVIFVDEEEEETELREELFSDHEREPLACCEDCGEMFEVDKLEVHRRELHPPIRNQFLQFSEGSFLMVADSR